MGPDTDHNVVAVYRSWASAGCDIAATTPLSSRPERFDDTGLRAVTDAGGGYRVALPAAGADPWYTAVAATPDVPTWAGRGTVGSVAP